MCVCVSRDEFPMILVGNKADLENERQVRPNYNIVWFQILFSFLFFFLCSDAFTPLCMYTRISLLISCFFSLPIQVIYLPHWNAFSYFLALSVSLSIFTSSLRRIPTYLLRICWFCLTLNPWAGERTWRKRAWQAAQGECVPIQTVLIACPAILLLWRSFDASHNYSVDFSPGDKR